MRSVGGTLGIWDEQRRAHRLHPRPDDLHRDEAFGPDRQPRPVESARCSRPRFERLQPLFPATDLHGVRIRTRCRLPSNRFRASGSIYAMTFGSTIYFRDELDEHNPAQLVHLIHEARSRRSGAALRRRAGLRLRVRPGVPRRRRPTAGIHRRSDRLPPQPARGRGLLVRAPVPRRRGRVGPTSSRSATPERGGGHARWPSRLRVTAAGSCSSSRRPTATAHDIGRPGLATR